MVTTASPRIQEPSNMPCYKRGSCLCCSAKRLFISTQSASRSAVLFFPCRRTALYSDKIAAVFLLSSHPKDFTLSLVTDLSSFQLVAASIWSFNVTYYVEKRILPQQALEPSSSIRLNKIPLILKKKLTMPLSMDANPSNLFSRIG